MGAWCSPLTYCGCHVYVILVIAQEWLHSHGSIAMQVMQRRGGCLQQKGSKVEYEDCKMVSKVLKEDGKERHLPVKRISFFKCFLFRTKFRFRKNRTFNQSLTTLAISFGSLSNVKLLESQGKSTDLL